MLTLVSMIRALNVGGANPLRMADLKAIHEAMGLTRVRTYLQSGNVVFDASTDDTLRLEAEIEGRLLKDRGIAAKVAVRTHQALAAAAAANPFAMRRGVDPKALYVTFLIRPSGRRSLAGVELPVRPGEEAVLKRDAVYVYCPHGYGDTRLNNAFFERRLACAATTRNWRTVNALLEMSAP